MSPVGPPAGRERAQVLLVGAVVLAVIILALVPVFNGVFAPDSAGNNEPREVADGPITLRQGHQTTARELAVRIGHRDVYADATPLVGELSTALGNFTRLSAEASVENRDRFVRTTLNESAPGTVVGSRVVQREYGDFAKPVPGTVSDWWVVGPGRDAELGWFVTRLDTTNLSRDDPLVVRVENDSAAMVVRVQRQDSSNDVRLSVDGTLATTDEPVTCDATAGQVVLDLYRGRAADRDCTFPGFERLSGPVVVEVEEGDVARGVYELVVRDEPAVGGTVHGCTDPTAVVDEPCHSPVLWQLSLNTTVSGGRTSYSNTMNVSVYGGGAR